MSQQTTRCSSSKNVSKAQQPHKTSLLLSVSEDSRSTNISSSKQTGSWRWSSRSILSHAGADGQRGLDSVLWRLRQLRRQLSAIFSTNKDLPPDDDTGQDTDVLTTTNSQRLNGSTRVLGSSPPAPLCPTTLPTLALSSPSTPNDFVNSLSSTPIGDNDQITSTYTPTIQPSIRSLESSTLMESLVFSSETPSVDPSLDTTFTPSFTLESTSIFTTGSSQTSESSFDSWSTDSSSTETPSSASDVSTPRPSTSTPDLTSSPSFTWTTNPSPSNELTTLSPTPYTTLPPSSSSSTLSLSSDSEVDVPVNVPLTASSRRSFSSRPGSNTMVSLPRTTAKVTRIYTTTYSEGHRTTVTTIIETGVLRTDVPSATSGLANNVGAIIGVTTGCLFGLIVCIILIFFCCRKHRRGHSHGDNEESLHPQSEWKPPLGDEFETGRGFLHGAALVAARLGRKFSNRSDSSDGGTYTNHSKNEDGRDGPRHIASNGSGETAQAPATSLTTPSGGLGYFPGMDQTLEGARSEEDVRLASLNGSSTAHDHPDAPTVAAAYRVSGSKSPSTMSKGGRYHASSASLLASSHGEGSSAETTQLGGASPARKRISLPGPHPRRSLEGKHHSSTPPVSFPIDTDLQEEVTEKGSLRGILNRLGDPIPTSKSIMPSSFSTLTHISNPFGSSESLANTTVVGPTSAQTTVARTLTMHSHSDVFSVPVSPPTSPILSFPQGVTGRDYVASHQPVTSPPAPLWPVFTLPPPPSPTDDSASIMVEEGLLHPRVTTMSSGSYQASRTSFDDHQDYSRPISGTLLGHIHQSLATTERQTSVSSAGSKSIQGL